MFRRWWALDTPELIQGVGFVALVDFSVGTAPVYGFSHCGTLHLVNWMTLRLR